MFVDSSSILCEQPNNSSVTKPCSFKEWNVLQNIEKKNNEKVQQYKNRIFLL